MTKYTRCRPSAVPREDVPPTERLREIPRSSTGQPAPLRVLLTGGSGGLGGVYAPALAAAGAEVLLTGRDEPALIETANGIRESGGSCEYVVADITAPGADRMMVDRMAEVFGGIDVVVNNAGVGGPVGPLWLVDEEEWWHAFEVNLRGTARVTRTVLPILVGQGGGRVINVVSRAGRLRWPHVTAYSVSKAGLISLTANLEGELRDTAVSVIAFDPGLVDVGMTRAHYERGETGNPWADEVLVWARRARSSGMFTSADDSARALVAVVSGAVDHLTGRYVTVADALRGGTRATR